MKNIILVFSIATVLFGCGQGEKNRLQSQVDSLSYVIVQNREAEIALEEVGVLLDSIDASRHDLNLKIFNGITYADYISRLKRINNHIKNSHTKIADLEAGLKKSKRVSATTIKRLKTDLEAKSSEIVDLQLQVVTLRQENRNQFMSLVRKDSIISGKDEVIRLKNADVSSLEGLVRDINAQNQIKVANLYFAQAEALETAADRTKFAPRKKKETRREALELYRLSFSMGNLEAGNRITKLEKDLS